MYDLNEFSNLIFIKESGLSLFPLRRKKLLEYLNKTISDTTYFEEHEKDYFKTKEILSSKVETYKDDILDFYYNYHVKEKPFDLKSSNLKIFQILGTPGNNFSRKTHDNDNQILDDFLEIQINKEIYFNDYFVLDSVDNYNYKNKIIILLLLEKFSQYTQSLSTIIFSKSKEWIEISIYFSIRERNFFSVEVIIPINNETLNVFDNVDGRLKINNNNRDVLTICEVKNVDMTVEIPIYNNIDFDKIFHNKKHPRPILKFFYQLEQPYLFRFYQDGINIEFFDLSKQSVHICIHNPPILISKSELWIRNYMKSDDVPICVIPLQQYLMDTLRNFDFNGIKYLSDISCKTFKNDNEDLWVCDNKQITLFISGHESSGRNFDRYNIFKLDINLETESSTIEFYGIENDYFPINIDHNYE